PSKRSAQCFQAFSDLVRAAWEATDATALSAVYRFLQNPDAVRAARAQLPAEATASSVFSFVHPHQAPALVSDDERVARWWRAQFAGGAENTGRLRCVVTGEPVGALKPHESVKGVPGGQSSGAALVSFNHDVYESYGLSRFENAPLHSRVATGYVRALNRLLSRRPSNPRYGQQPGENGYLPQRCYALSTQQSVLLYWARQSDPFEDQFASWFDVSEGDVQTLLQKAERGGGDDGALDTNRFYALILSGAQGRSILRSWIDVSLGQVKRNLARYFQDLQIVGLEGHGSALRLRSLLEATAPLGKGDAIHPALEEALVRAAMQGAALPPLLLQQVVLRLAGQSADGTLSGYRWTQRAALLRAYLNRRRRGQREVTVQLDESNHDPAYLLGRSFAILEKLQKDAVNPGQTIRDRFYASASMAPASVMPRLIRGAQPHISKAKNGGYLHKKLGDVLAGVRQFPSTLDLTSQGLFALGYYHQNHALYQSKGADTSPAEQHEIQQPQGE
ncbi:MAG: type I-C CRISPR-associated protein Cas8c/Csd1, partial [Polyangiales bacterium]